jgi:hypothetical protein
MITFQVQLKGKIQFETTKYYIVEVGLYVCIPSEKQSCSTVHMKAGYTQHVLFASLLEIDVKTFNILKIIQ